MILIHMYIYIIIHIRSYYTELVAHRKLGRVKVDGKNRSPKVSKGPPNANQEAAIYSFQ